MKGIKMSEDFFCCRQLCQIDCCTYKAFFVMHYFGQSATIKLTHVFLVAGWWVTLDFDSWGETGAYGVPFHERKKTKFQTRICIIIPTPCDIMKHVRVKGVTYPVLLQTNSKFLCCRQKWPVDYSFFD